MTDATVNEHCIADALPPTISSLNRGKMLVLTASIVIYSFVFPICFMGERMSDASGAAKLALVAGWMLPPLLASLLMIPIVGDSWLRKGERLRRKGKLAGAARAYAHAVRWHFPEAGLRLGDMHLPGGGMETDVDKAVGWYAKALANFELNADWEEPPGGGPASGDRDNWLIRLEETLSPIEEAGNTAARSLLAEVRWLRGAHREALALARSLPESGPVNRLDGLSRLLGRQARLSRLGDWHKERTEAERAEEEKAYPGVVLNRFWSRRDNWLGVPAIFLILYVFGICVVGQYWGIPETYIPLLVIVIPGIVAALVWRRMKRDPYQAGERLFRDKAYKAAAMEFSVAYDNLHPGAAKRLGEMRLDGLGVERDLDKAFEAYGRAAAHALSQSMRKKEDTPGALDPRFPELDNDSEAYARWKAELVRGLERLAASGILHAYSLLDDIAWRDAKDPRYARLAFEAAPTPENETTLAMRTLHGGNADAGSVRRHLDALERLLGEGHFAAGCDLVDTLLDGTDSVAADPELALVLYRRLLRETKPDPRYERIQGFARIYQGLEIMEKLGCDALTDDDCLLAAGVSESPP